MIAGCHCVHVEHLLFILGAMDTETKFDKVLWKSENYD